MPVNSLEIPLKNQDIELTPHFVVTRNILYLAET